MASASCGCFSHFSTVIIRYFLLRSIFLVNETRAASGSRNPASDFGHSPHLLEPWRVALYVSKELMIPATCTRGKPGKWIFARRLGLANQENFGSQALRAYMATKLANDQSVSIEESMASLCHSSVSAHRTYIKRNSLSEYNKYRALGLFRNT